MAAPPLVDLFDWRVVKPPVLPLLLFTLPMIWVSFVPVPLNTPSSTGPATANGVMQTASTPVASSTERVRGAGL